MAVARAGASLQRRIVDGNIVFHQVGFHFDFLVCGRIDLGFEGLESGQSDLDHVLAGRNQQRTADTVKLADMPDETSVHEDGGAVGIHSDLDAGPGSGDGTGRGL